MSSTIFFEQNLYDKFTKIFTNHLSKSDPFLSEQELGHSLQMYIYFCTVIILLLFHFNLLLILFVCISSYLS